MRKTARLPWSRAVYFRVAQVVFGWRLPMIFSVRKRSKKTLLYALIATLIITGGFSTFADLRDQAYTVRTVHVFPGEITAEGFRNAETLTFQNVDEYALLQEFNAINSAVLTGGVYLPPEEEDSSETTDTPDTDSAQQQLDAFVDDVQATTTDESVDTVDTTTSSTTQGTEEQTQTAAPDAVTESDSESDGQSTPDETVPAVESDPQPSEPEPESQPEAQEDQVSATTTVRNEVTRLFALAIDTLTDTFSSTSPTSSAVTDLDEPDEPEGGQEQPAPVFGFVSSTSVPNTVSSSTAATDVSDQESDTSTSSQSQTAATSSQSVSDQGATTSQPTTQEEEVLATSTVATATTSTSTAPAPGDIVAASPDCGTSCTGHALRLNNFAFPLDEGVELSGAQLRLSMAAKHKATREEIPSLTINYSLDAGGTWSTGGSIVIDDEVSNSINGGYYLFALPTITDQAVLGDLHVEIRYDDDPALVDDLFVESVWLELFTLEPPTEDVVTPFADLLEADGFIDSKLSGDVLALPDQADIKFTFTDDNEDETLIIKSDQKTYDGLSQAVTYFNITNTGSQSDTFSVQTYFPASKGEVTNLEVFNLNKPRDAVVSEYRPYVYHCEAGWSGAAVGTATGTELSFASTSSSTATSTATSTQVASTDGVPDALADVASTTQQYSCGETSVVRICEVIEGEGTACVITQKVADHDVVRYAPGWDAVATDVGELSDGGIFRRAASLLGFAPQRKDVPASFEPQTFTEETFNIAPGETLYFRMDISFPPFSTGEYWIEAVGEREYGLLDPFWRSDWQYRTPITVGNPTGTDQTEFQVQLSLDSTLTDFWANVDSAGDDLRFVQEVQEGNLVGEVGPAIDNTYNPDWQGRVALTIEAAGVGSTLEQFPVYVNLADLGSDFWTGVATDGRDIRVTAADGETELPYELVAIDVGSETGELYFRAPILSSTEDTIFHIYYDNPSAAAYADSDPFGAENVWSNGYVAVYHFEEGNAAGRDNVGHYTDSTASGFDAEDDTLSSGDTGYTGRGVEFDVTNALAGTDTFDHLNIDPAIMDGQDAYTVTAWYQASSTGANTIDHTFVSGFSVENEIIIRVENGERMEQFVNADENNAGQTVLSPRINDDTWRQFAFTFSDTADELNHYVDGTLEYNDPNVDTNGLIDVDPGGLIVGHEQDVAVDAMTGTGEGLDGMLDNLRFSTVVRSADWISAEHANQSAPTTFYSTSTDLIQTSAGVNWFSTSWNGRQMFTIDRGAVTGTQSDFPVYLDLSVLGSDFFSRVASDGRDIRITTDDATTQLPFELVGIDTGSETGELYFKTTISGGESFYIYYDNEDALAYDRSAPYGSENVWTNGFQAVYHFEEELAGVGNLNLYQDSTANQYHGDDDTTDTDVTGLLGQGVGFGSDVNDVIKLPNEVLDGVTDYSVSWWHNTTQLTDASIVSAANFSQNNEFLLFFPTTTQLNVYHNGPAEGFALSDTVGSFNTGLWQHYLVTADQSEVEEVSLYVNGQGDTENPDDQDLVAFDVPNGGLVVGQDQDAVSGAYDPNQRFIGQLDELRIATAVRDEDWAATTYANQSDVISFFATSSPETLTVTEFVELDYWLYDWDFGSQTATIWLQVEDLPAAGALVYAYYGNGSAAAVSSEIDTFSYDTLTPTYHVVDNSGAGTIAVVSLTDNNQVQLDGGTVVDLNQGERTTFTTYGPTSVLSTLAPVSAVVVNSSGDGTDILAPIAFATTTFSLPTNRSNNNTYVYAPFAGGTVDSYVGGSGTADQSQAIAAQGTVTATANPGGSGTGIADDDGILIESTTPVLVTHRSSNPGDGVVAYPPTLEDLYGIHSNNTLAGATADNPDPTYYCSSGGTGTYSNITRGDQEVETTYCAIGNEGAGDAVRFTGQSEPLAVYQQADTDGNETTVFWPLQEFGTQYAFANTAAYAAVACAPDFGAVTLEVRDALGGLIESGTCTPGVNTPGKAYFTAGTSNGDSANFAAGSMVVSTNGIPFYMIWEDVSLDQDEKNTLGTLQARKYGAGPAAAVFGQQEEANGPQYEQLSFAWYENAELLTPTSTWPLGGGEFITEGDAISGTGAISEADVLRLRMNIVGGNATSTAGTEAFILQYSTAAAGVCSADDLWLPVGSVGSTTAAFSGYNNAGVADGSTLDTLVLASSTLLGTYEERNLSDFNPVDLPPGGVMEFDWVLTATDVSVNTTYCFRMVRAIGEVFPTYTAYPELETVGPPNTPQLISLFDNEHTSQLTPELVFVASDIAGDDVHYEIQIDDDVDFGSIVQTEDSAANFLAFTNLSSPADKAPFTSGAQVRYDPTAALTDGTTYWWRVRASDPDGSATTSAWSTPFSFTTDSTVTVSEWLQTTGDQFSTNELTSVSTSTGAASMVGASGVMVGTAIDFDDATVGNAWGEVDWNSTEVSATTSIQVQFNNNGVWQLVSDSDLPGNSLGYTSGPVSILALDTDTYNEIRLVGNFTGTTASLQDWTVRWAQRVEIPTQGDLFDNQKTADTLPVFDLVSTDPQGDDLEYEISFSTDFDFAGASTTYNSGSSPQFANSANGADTSPFTSGDQITFTTPGGTPFTNGTTYWWRSRAKDPAGGDAFSPWSQPDSFTIDTGTTLSTWFQTTQDQFNQGIFNGLIASTSGSVELTDNVGEFGRITLSNNAWTTINTQNSYRDMVVVASPEFDFNGTNNGRTARVRNKGDNSFEIKVDNYLNSFSGSTEVDYIVMEAGLWTIDDGGSGFQLLAATEENVTEKQIESYADDVTRLITYPVEFTPIETPVALAVVSSDNDSDWIGSHIDDGDYQDPVSTTQIGLSLARSRHSASTHSGGEDIDYLVIEQASGVNNGTQFQFEVSGNVVEGGAGGNTVTIAGFSSAPAVTVVHNNGDNGAQGGFAQKDTGSTNNATTLALNNSEQGATADGHIANEVSIAAFESASGVIKRLDSGGLTSNFTGEDIIFSDGAGPKFDNFSWVDTTPGGSDVTIRFEYLVSEGVYATIPDSQISGNAAGNSTSPIDLTSVNIDVYPQIRAAATLTCNGTDCPTLDEWQLEWSEGVNMSGTLREYDRLSAVATGTIRAAVNGVPVAGSGTVAAGVWTLNNVTAFAGDIVTVWVDDAVEAEEAVTSFIYDGLGDISGVALYEQHVTFEADEFGGAITNQLLGLYDNTDDEDIMFAVDGLFNLAVCGTGTCPDANLYVGPSQTYIPATSGAVTVSTHDFINDGTIELDTNNFTVSGSWDNNATSSIDLSTISLTAATGTESISSVESPLNFHNLSFGGSGMATFTIAVPLDLSGDLTVATGTLARDGFDITVEGSVTTEFGGVWAGTATTTFDGTGTVTWRDNNLVSQNIGNVIIDGASKIVSVQSNVAAYDVVIGGNDTLLGGTGNTIYVAGDWDNTGLFTAGTSIVEIVPDDREYPPVIPGSADWYSDTAFDQRIAVTVDGSEVPGPLTNFPLYVDLSTLGAGFWAGVQSNGRDIRVTSGDGQTELPYDLVTIDTAAQTGELHLLADSVSSTADTTFYVYFDNPLAVAPAADSTYGSEAVWHEYEAVYHFNESRYDIGDLVLDATRNDRDMSVLAANLGTTTGQLGQALDLDGLAGYATDADFSWTSGDRLTVSGWYFMTGPDVGNDALWRWGDGTTDDAPSDIRFYPWYGTDTGLFYFGQDGGDYTISPRTGSIWRHYMALGATSTSENNLVYEDAILRESVLQDTANPSNTNGFTLGQIRVGQYIDAVADELRVATTSRTSDWVEAEYTNQFSPTIFYATTSPESYVPAIVVDEATHTITAGGSAFYTLRLNDATTTPIFTDASFVVNDDFIVATGTVALPTGVLTVGGSFLNNGFIMHNNGSVEFTSTGAETIQLQGTDFLNALYNVTFDGPGSWTFTDINATTSGFMQIDDGTVVFPSGVLAIGDTLMVETGGAAFDNNSGTVRFTSGESESVQTAGSAFNDVIFGAGDSFGWYDIAWPLRESITINAAEVNETLTDFPVYIDLSHLDDSFWSNVQSTGDDIRITTSDGSTELAYELVSIDTIGQTGQLHFKADAISAVIDTTFYVYYGNTSATPYAVDDPYGRNAVWTNGYEAVLHLEESGTGAPDEYIDSTGNGYDGQGGGGTATNVPAQATGQLGQAQDFENGAPEDWIDLNTSMIAGLEGANTKSVTAWINVESFSDTGGIWNVGGTAATGNDFSVTGQNVSGSWATRHQGTPDYTYLFGAESLWYHIAVDYDGSTSRTLGNANQVGFEVVGALDTQDSNGYGILIGRWRTGNYFDGLIDEIRFSSVNRSDGWYAAEYGNQANPATFYATSSAQSLSDSTAIFTLDEAATDVDGNLTISGSQLIAPTTELTIGGSAFNNNGIYDPNNATTTFNSTDLGETFDFGDTSLYNLAFDGVGGGWTVGTTTVVNNLTLTTGASYVQATNTTMTVGGRFVNQFASAATDWTTSTLVLTGGDYIITDRLGAGDDYAVVEVSNDSDIVIWNSTISTSSVQDTSSMYMPDFGGIDGQLNIYGQYERTTGAEYWSYATDFDGTDLTGGGERQANVFLEGGTSVTLGTSTTLQMIGDPSASTTLRSLFGIYTVTLQNATLEALRVDVADTAPTGIELTDGTTVTTLEYVDFAVAPGRSAVTVDDSTINTQPSTGFSNVNFTSAPATTIYRSGWTEQLLLTINASSTGQTLTDFPVYVNLADLGSAFWAGVRSDGADIRVTTDLGREVAVEVVEIDAGAQTGEIYFLAPEVSAITDTDFYVHYNNPTAILPAVTDQYGRNAVWGGYEAVYHFATDPLGGIADASGNGRDLEVTAGTAATTTGLIGTAVDTTAGNVALEDTDWTWTAGDDLVSSGLFFQSALDTGALWQFGIAVGGGGANDRTFLHYLPWYDSTDRGYHRFGEPSGGDYRYTLDTSVWHHFTTIGRATAGELNELYENNILRDSYTQTTDGQDPTNTGLQIGRYQTTTYMDIDVDELRFTTEIPTNSWREAEFYNLTNPGGFYGTSTGPTETFNITTDGVPTTFWAFANGVGDIYGEAFDNDDGDPGAIQWDDSNFNITIAGSVYQDDGVTPMSPDVCNGSTEVVTLVLDGTTTYQTSCDPFDGSYEISGITFTGEPKVTAYLESTAVAPSTKVQVYDQVETSGVVAGGNITLTTARVIDDSVLVAIIGRDDNAGGTIGTPAGWTAIDVINSGTGDDWGAGMWYRVVSDASTEPSTYDFTSGDNGEGFSGWMGSLVNVDTSNVIDVTNTWNVQTNISNPVASDITTVTNNALVLAAWYAENSPFVASPGQPWRQQSLVSNGDNGGLLVSSLEQPVAGVVGATAAYPASFAETSAIQVAFRADITPTATGVATAAVVSKTPIGSADPYAVITLRDQRTDEDTVAGGADIVVPVPTVEDDDLLVAVITRDDNFGFTGPAGWVLADEFVTTSGSDMTLSVWYRQVTDASGEPASYNFTSLDTDAEAYSYWIGSFSGVDTTMPFDVTPTIANIQDDQTPAAQSVTTVTPNTRVLAIWGIENENTMDMPGGAWETVIEDIHGGNVGLSIATQVFTSAGATGDVTVSSVDATTDDTLSVQVALRPAPISVPNQITDFDLYQNRVIVRHEDISPLSIADMNTFDAGDEADLPFTVSTSSTPDTLNVAAGSGLYVWGNNTFDPDGLVTLDGTGATFVDGTLTIGPGATYQATGTNALTVGGSFTGEAGAVYNGANSLVTFTATGTGQMIASAASSTFSLYDVAFTGVGGAWNVQTPILVDQDVLVSTGTVTGISDITVDTGDFYGDGLVSMVGGRVQLNSSSTLGGTTPWTFHDLTLGDGAVPGVTTPATVTTTVANQLTINAGHFLDAGSSVWNLSGSGSVFIESGTFLEDDSTVRYSGATPTILRTAYHNLEIDTNSGGTVTATAPVTGLQVLGDLSVGVTGTSTLDLDINDPTLGVNGDVIIGPLGTLTASNVNPINIFGSWDNDGTFTANGGLVEFLSATGTQTIAAGMSPFAQVVIDGDTLYTMTESATATQALTLSSSGFTLQSGEVLAVGGPFTNNIPDGATTWTGTTLRLFGGQSYTVNPKIIGDVYDTIEVSGNTHPRFWNASTTAIITETGSSLYSQDHEGVDGSLYIFGDFVNDAFDDHWSYLTDFDGATLGTGRSVTVQVEDGGSVLYTGGSLTVLGTTTASSSIAAQGAGPYSLTVGGTTTVDMNYYTVREVDSAGLTLTGTPTVTDLSFGDFEPVTGGASGITLGGTVINVNQAQNFTNNRFATTTAISAFNVTATGSAVSSWRFVNVDGNLDGEDFDSDPAGDPGYVVWQDSAAVIDISGTVYQSDRTTASAVCDGMTNNVRLSIAGLAFASTTCAAGTGAFTFPTVGFGPNDTLTVYIDGELVRGATVTKDPISLINNLDVYENHVVVRHESVAPMTIAAMSVYDSSNDPDIPFTAVDAGTDTLDLPTDFALVVWNDKVFSPQGNVTIPGAGGGASYDGLLELYTEATFDAGTAEEHSIGGSLISAVDATFDADTSTTTFSSNQAGLTIDTNDNGFHNLAFTGTGSWTISDTEGDVNNDLSITGGTVTLPAATTTVSGSFVNSGGSFAANAGTLVFDGTTTGNSLAFGGSDAHEVIFTGTGSWSFIEAAATTTDSFTVATGTVTLPTGTLTVGQDFVVTDTIAHAGGAVILTSTAGGNVVTLSGNDLTDLIVAASAGDYTLTDADATLLGNLTITDGAFISGTGTVAIGGSFDASGGTFTSADGTLLFNSDDAGEFIDPGANDLYSVVIAGTGGWTLAANATTTQNFSLTNAGTFVATPGITLHVGNVFSNTVGGAATTWAGATVVLDGHNEYETNSKLTATELYDTLILGENTDISSWNTSATTVTVPSTSSWYSQDHAGTNGLLQIYGDYHIATTTEYWSAATDFDGAVVAARPVTVQIASSSTVTVEDAGTLNIVGLLGTATTTITNQGVGAYTFVTTGGTLNASVYTIDALDVVGLQLLGNTTITTLSNGFFTQTTNDQALITLASTTLNTNAGLVVTDTGFADGGFTGGVNVSLDATTTNSWSFVGTLGNLWGEAFDVDGTDDCSSVRWDDSSCLLTEQSDYRWRNDDGGEGALDSEWYDTNWSKRQRIRVINDDATAYASTAVKFNLPYDTDMQADFDDIRITAADGVTLVPYWIEQVNSGSEAIVWLLAPTLAADTVSLFYVYYGNVGAVSTSDGAAVFTAIEDFEANDLTVYEGDDVDFEITSSFAFGGSLGLDATGAGTNRSEPGIIRNDITVAQGDSIRYMQYIDPVAGNLDEACTLFGTQGDATDIDNYAICVQKSASGDETITLARDVEYTSLLGTSLTSGTVDLSVGWYEFVVDWGTDNSIAIAIYDDAGTSVLTLSASDSTYISGGVGFAYWFQRGGWDSLVAYPSVTTIPTVYLGAEQDRGGATWAGSQNSPTGGFLFGEVARLRVGIENTGLDIENQNFQLEYAAKLTAPTCEAVSPASFTAVPPLASAGLSPVRMITSTQVTDGDTTTDHLVTTAGDFVSGEVVTDPSNETSNLDVAQNRYTELEYAVTLTVNAVNDAYCFRVTDSGDALDSYANLPELTLAFDPVLDPVDLNNGLDIDLTAGIVTTVTASTTVTDFNGVADLRNATTTFYTSAAGPLCTANDNNCYISTTTCSFTNCSGTSCTLSCTADFAYHADPTDLDGGNQWFAYMEVDDQSGASDLETSTGVELLTLRGIDVRNAIAYGVVDVNQSTGVFNPDVSLVNIGNESIDVQISGTDMSDEIASVIPAGQQLFSTSTFDYDSCIGCTPLSVLGTNVEVDLDKPVSTTPETTDTIYWGIEVPFGTASNPHTGLNTFTAVAD